MVFEELLFFLSVTLQSQRTVRSMGTYFEQILCHGLWIDFDAVFIFFTRDCLSDALEHVHLLHQVVPQFS